MKLVCLLLCINILSLSAEVSFTKDIRPILSKYCFYCHGPDKETREAKLRLDTKEGLFTTRKKRFPVVAENPHTSEIFKRMITDDEDDIMPPPESKKEMSKAEIELIKKWIEEGADYEDHWAFTPPKKHSQPKVNQKDWPLNFIDNFILAELESKGMKPSPAADKETLIRRLYLDLTGLPPSIKDVDRFLNDKSPDAYEKTVDSLLTSKAHAERLTVDWLDAARYADTNGYSIDDHRDMWAWRDWVINAFHKNMSYDQFMTEQLAGDIIAKKQDSQQNNMSSLPKWIWKKGPVKTEEAKFKKTFTIKTIPQKALLQASCDNTCTIFINGKEVAKSNHWQNEPIFKDVAQYLKQGENHILVNATNEGNIAGLVFHLDTGEKTVISDKTWMAKSPEGKWHKAVEINHLGAEPWGKILKVDIPHTELTEEEQEQIQKIVATGFLRNSMNTHEGGTIAEEYRVQYNVDKVDTVSTVFMGLTVKCSQCHDHKYDPISQKNFFEVYAFFNNSSEGGKGAVNGNTKPLIEVNSILTSKDEMIASYQARVFELERQKAAIDPKKDYRGFKGAIMIKSLNEEIRVIQDQIKKGRTSVMVMDEKGNRETFILDRGQYNKPTAKVTVGVPEAILPFPSEAPKNRLGLAQWLLDEKNPLTARVAVNRFWQLIYGTGIVKTSEDFGNQGEVPSHPKLLDDLAIDFRDNGWNVRRLLKQIVMSATYRQSSINNTSYAEKDPYNRLFWRAPVFRLQAEFVRDNALSIAGILNYKTGGPSVYPPQPEGLWAQVSHYGHPTQFTAQAYYLSKPQNHVRRSMYTVIKRTAVNPTMAAFDAPIRETCTPRRLTTNTPLQSLALMNDLQFVSAAKFLGQRMKKQSSKTAERLRYGFRLATSRNPSKEELEILLKSYKVQKGYYSSKKSDAEKLLGSASANAEDAALTMLASTILNLSETVTRN
ncbi:MAG: PSD1 and planctomycete cytochrome C domain-containing protein [Lentisphaeraceae bacterium]|nr:PSD1 and planctomycete cytochrome C domain-containing protein [Lentisphaeraceae bacterium]